VVGIELTVALLAGTVTAVGWFINHVLNERAERRRQHLQAQLKFTTQQLEELYGPLVFLINEGQHAWDDLLNLLGREYVFVEVGSTEVPLPPEELKAWMFWAEHSFMPLNREIRRLLSTKTHLIEGSVMPDSFDIFLKHYSTWEIRHLRWTKEQVEYSWHSSTDWPKEFESNVREAFRILKERHTRLIGQL
jgi:hypothetical protein